MSGEAVVVRNRASLRSASDIWSESDQGQGMP